jgi:exonuclease VII large subunit
MSLWRRRMSYHKKYYEKNRETLLKYYKKYYEKNKETKLKQQRRQRTENKEARLCIDIKSRIKNKNISFNLDEEYVKEIWPKDDKCPALNIEFKRGEGMQIDASPSIDRIIPELGYVKGNVQIICMLANRIKSNATPKQVMSVAKYFKKIVEKKNAA